METNDIKAKHPEIATQLRRKILGAPSLSRKLPNNRELAAKFGVTPITVRKAILTLEKEGLVETKHRLGTFITEEAYEKRRCTEIALVVLDLFTLSHPYFEKIAKGFIEVLNGKKNYNVQLLTIPEKGPGRHGGLRRLKDMVQNGMLDGIAITVLLTKEEIADLWACGVPLVSVGRRYKAHYPFVMEDVRQIVETLAEEIIGRKCSCVSVVRPVIVPAAVEMEEDIFAMLFTKLAEAGVEAGYKYLFAPKDEETSEEMGHDATAQLLRANPQIDCLIAVGHHFLKGAKKYLEEAGRLSDEAFTFIGMTDEEDLGNFPTLTGAITEMGREAGRILMEQFELGRQKGLKQVRLPAQWIRR